MPKLTVLQSLNKKLKSKKVITMGNTNVVYIKKFKYPQNR